MHRQPEKIGYIPAALLSLAVHGLLLLALLISVNWKTTQPMVIAEVELWDSLPTKALPTPLPEPTPKPAVEVKPLTVLTPVVEKPIDDEPLVDIALEKKKAEEKLKKELQKELEQKQALDKKKKLAEIKQAMLKEEQLAREEKLKEQKLQQQNEALKKLAQQMLAEDNTASSQRALSAKAAANASIVGEYQNKIRQKIRSNVNKSLCGSGNPELKFDLSLQPTGMLSGAPKLTKSSGNRACDEAVERAIIASAPLPLPSEASLFSQFRNLKLTFRPNE
jgi:colicin import membrane protein